jgi:hypothetical protein
LVGGKRDSLQGPARFVFLSCTQLARKSAERRFQLSRSAKLGGRPIRVGYRAGLPRSPQPAEARLNPQTRNPLHGITLERLLTELVEQCGWEALGRAIDIRCFTHEPSIASSLKFLRRTPWAREKVESYYLYMQRQKAREAKEAR